MFIRYNRRGQRGVVVSILELQLKDQRASPGLGVLCCFLRQESLLHIAFLHPGIQMCTGNKLLGKHSDGLASYPGWE